MAGLALVVRRLVLPVREGAVVAEWRGGVSVALALEALTEVVAERAVIVTALAVAHGRRGPVPRLALAREEGQIPIQPAGFALVHVGAGRAIIRAGNANL